MLHCVPMRRERTVELLLCLLSLWLMCAGFTVFYLLWAPNWDVVLLCGATVAALSPALLPLAVACFGESVLQVEFEGVVLSERCFGRTLHRRVWAAEQMRGFDWERDTDGQLSLRLLIQRTPLHRPKLMTVLHTASAYAFASVWRDLELHYPGSGLRETPPSENGAPQHGSRLIAGVVLLAGLALLWWAGPSVLTPLSVCARGAVYPAEILALEWDSAAPGSTYHLRVRSEQHSLRSAAAFRQTVPMPRIGQRLAVLHAGGSVFYLPDEVLPFLMPMLASGAILLLLLLGVLGLRPTTHRH